MQAFVVTDAFGHSYDPIAGVSLVTDTGHVLTYTTDLGAGDQAKSDGSVLQVWGTSSTYFLALTGLAVNPAGFDMEVTLHADAGPATPPHFFVAGYTANPDSTNTYDTFGVQLNAGYVEAWAENVVGGSHSGPYGSAVGPSLTLPATVTLRVTYDGAYVKGYVNGSHVVTTNAPLSIPGPVTDLSFGFQQGGATRAYGATYFDNLRIAGFALLDAAMDAPNTIVPGRGLVKVGDTSASTMIAQDELPSSQTYTTLPSSEGSPSSPPIFTAEFIASLQAAGVITSTFPYAGQTAVGADGWLYTYMNGQWMPTAFLGAEWVTEQP